MQKLSLFSCILMRNEGKNRPVAKRTDLIHPAMAAHVAAVSRANNAILIEQELAYASDVLVALVICRTVSLRGCRLHEQSSSSLRCLENFFSEREIGVVVLHNRRTRREGLARRRSQCQQRARSCNKCRPSTKMHPPGPVFPLFPL